MIIYDVGNWDSTNKSGNLLLSCMSGLFPEVQKGYRNGTRGINNQLYVDQHIYKETRMSPKNVAMAWINSKKAYHIVLQIRIIVFVQNIWQNHKLHHGCHGKLEGANDNGNSNSSKGKNSKRHLPERLTLTTTIRFSNDNTKPRGDVLVVWVKRWTAES